MEHPEGSRSELVSGTVIGMTPERWTHMLIKLNVARRLFEAFELIDHVRLPSVDHYLIVRTEDLAIIRDAPPGSTRINRNDLVPAPR